MAVPQVTFSEDGRVKAARILGVIHWICIAPAVLCLLTALYIQLVIADQIYFIENYNGHVLPGFLVFTGFFSFIGHILCGKAFWANHKEEKREKWSKFLLPAVIVTLLIFLFQLIAGIICIVHVGELEDSLASGITTAMKGYKNDLTTKTEMDMLQIEYECCGSRSYQDWFKVVWVHPDYKSLLHSKSNKRLTSDDVPFSCCSPHVLRPCISHHVHDNDKHYNYDYRVKTTLYKKGCADKLMEFYENTLLSNGGAIILGLSFIQLIVGAVGRLFQTALANSMEADDDQGESIGYLFGQVGGEKDTVSDLDTTTETADADTTEEKTLVDSEETTEEPAYMPMDGLDPAAEEPLYENIRPNQDEAEHIYHDEEVEQYLLDKYNKSKHYFETLSSDASPTLDRRNSVVDDVAMGMTEGEFPREPSGIYDEPLPYPSDDFSTGGIRTNGRSSSSIRKQSSTYASYNPPQAKQAEVIYENIMPGAYSGTGNNQYDIPGPPYPYLNNSSIVANNLSRNYNPSIKENGLAFAVRPSISRSPVPKKNTKSNSKINDRISNAPKMATGYFSKTSKYGSINTGSPSKNLKAPQNSRILVPSKNAIGYKSCRSTEKYLSDYGRNISGPHFFKKFRSMSTHTPKPDNPSRKNTVKEQVHDLKQTPEPLYSSGIKRDEPSRGRNTPIQMRPGTQVQDSSTVFNQQTRIIKPQKPNFPRPVLQRTRVQPENYNATRVYTPNTFNGNGQETGHSSSNIRNCNVAFSNSPQYYTVYQPCHSALQEDNRLVEGVNAKASPQSRETNGAQLSQNNTSSLRYRSVLNDEKNDSQSSGMDYGIVNRQTDDTGIYIDSPDACENKSSNSATHEHRRTQSLSPIYPIKTTEPISQKKENSSEDDTIVINLLSFSSPEACPVVNKTD